MFSTEVFTRFKESVAFASHFLDSHYTNSYKISPIALRRCRFVQSRILRRGVKRSNVRVVKDSDDFSRFESSLSRTKSRCIEVLECNLFDSYSVMGTLTFAENLTDYDVAYSRWSDFARGLKKTFPNVKYVCVPEVQKRGAYHFHFVLLNLTKEQYYGTSSRVEAGWFSMDLWSLWSPQGSVEGYDFVKIKRIGAGKCPAEDTARVSRYLSKYFTKETVPVVANSRRLLLVSLGLNRYFRCNDSNLVVKWFFEGVFNVLKPESKYVFLMDFFFNKFDYDVPPSLYESESDNMANGLCLDQWGNYSPDVDVDKFFYMHYDFSLFSEDIEDLVSRVVTKFALVVSDWVSMDMSDFDSFYPLDIHYCFPHHNRDYLISLLNLV